MGNVSGFLWFGGKYPDLLFRQAVYIRSFEIKLFAGEQQIELQDVCFKVIASGADPLPILHMAQFSLDDS